MSNDGLLALNEKLKMACFSLLICLEALVISHFSFAFLISHFSFNNVTYVVIAFSISLMQINSSAV